MFVCTTFSEVVHEKAESVLFLYALFYIYIFFLTNILLLCWPVDRSCYNLNKLETEVANPQYLLHWH